MPCQDYNNRPVFRMAHIPRNHFAETFFEKAFVQWTRTLLAADQAWLWGTYGGMRDHGLVQSCEENPVTLSIVEELNGPVLFIASFEERHVEVRERGYAILDVAGFGYSTNADLFHKVEVPFNQPEYL